MYHPSGCFLRLLVQKTLYHSVFLVEKRFECPEIIAFFFSLITKSYMILVGTKDV